MEKPIGHDLKSSKEINDEVAKVFKEDKCFGSIIILGKETVIEPVGLAFRQFDLSLLTGTTTPSTISKLP